MSTPEERVNQKVEQLRAYKDAQGMDRTQQLTQKQRDEALHNSITGNVAPATSDEQAKVDAAMKKAEKKVTQLQKPPNYSVLDKVATEAAKPENQGNNQLQLADALRKLSTKIPGMTVTEEPPEEQIGPIRPSPGVTQNTNVQPDNTIGGQISELAQKRQSAGPETTSGLPPGYTETTGPNGEQIITQPRVYQNVSVPPSRPGEGGLWGEPKPVEPAEPIKEPGMGKTALAALGAFLPGVGGFMMEPYRQAQKDYLVKTERDKELTTLFWNEMKSDPITAKRFSRIPAVRDALQRNYGMTGDEILELDKSISKDTAMTAQQFFDLLGKGVYEGPEQVETPFGTLQRRKEMKEYGGVPYSYDSEKKEWVPEQTEMMKRYEQMRQAYLTGGAPEHLATLYANRALKGQPIWNRIDMGNGFMVMANDVTGSVQTYKFDEAVKKEVGVKFLEKPFTKEPYAAFFYPKGASKITLDDVQLMTLANIRDQSGNNAQEEVTRLYNEAVKNGEPGAFEKMYSYVAGLFGGMDVSGTDKFESQEEYSQIIAEQQKIDQQAAEQRQNRTHAPITPPPAVARADAQENKKVKDLLNTAVGDI